MANSLRSYEPENIALSQVLTYTDLVPDITDPHRYLVDPVTGQKWKRLNYQQELIAQELLAGANHREACARAGTDMRPESASSYVSSLLSKNAPFVNHLLNLINEERQSKFVTKETHLRRLDELGRRAEKEGKYSAAIAAEVNRGRVAGLYAKDQEDPDSKTAKSLSSIDARINQLLSKESARERKIEGQVVSEQKKGGKG